MSVCTECSTIPEYECKTCEVCNCAYCSTECRAPHQRRCALLTRLPERTGSLSERFIQKPGFGTRLAKWRSLATCCMICYFRGEGLARSGGVVLCNACYTDFVMGKRAKKKRPPPKFDISEWVSAEDMKVVEAGRREQAEFRRMYAEYCRDEDRASAVSRNNCLIERRIRDMSTSDEMRYQLLGIWDATRKWGDVINAHFILENGGELPYWVAPRAWTVLGVLSGIWNYISSFTLARPEKIRMDDRTEELVADWNENITMVRPPARRRRPLVHRTPRPRLAPRADNVADMTEAEARGLTCATLD